MPRFLLALIFGLFLYTTANAQKGGLMYYLKNSGKVVSIKDSADYFMLLLPPDTSVNKNLYVVYEYNKDGKVRLITNSKTNDINLQYHGRYLAYFPNGKRKKTGEFAYGVPVGQQIDYYPNGKFYSSMNYFPGNKILFNEYRDSTGKVLAENGTGSWIQFDERFINVIAQGKIDSGMRVGEWHERYDDSITLIKTYKNGMLLTTDTVDPWGKKVFTPVDIVPEFPGGIEAFVHFLAKNIRYPAVARKNGTQGNVFVSFVVDKDGTLTDLKVIRGIGDGCNEESLRVIKLSPPWKPGMQNNHPVRVAYSMPISFALSK
jgi:TonB family protein